MKNSSRSPYSDRVFISYASEDFETALRLYEDLKRAGAKPWIDRRDLKPGIDWEDEIKRVIRACAKVVVIVSERSKNRRGFIQKEIRMALDTMDEFPPGEIFLIPARLQECTLDHEKLRRIQWVDLFPDSKWESGVGKIVEALGLSGSAGENRRVRGTNETFCKDVVEIYRLMGGVKVSEIPKHPNCFLVSRRDPITYCDVAYFVMTRLLHSESDDEKALKRFVGLAKEALFDGPASSAFLIVNRKPSPDCLDLIPDNRFDVRTRDRILDDLVNFHRYFEVFVEKMESDDRYRLLETYVKLNFSTLDIDRTIASLHPDRTNSDSKAFQARLPTYNKRNSYVSGDGTRPELATLDLPMDSKPLVWILADEVIDKYAEKWLRDEETPWHITILGDFGAGKTSFCKMLTYRLIKQRLQGDASVSSRIPLYVPLKSYARLEGDKGAETLLTDCLANDYEVPATFKAIQKLMRAGKLLLILDGFDEMAQKVDPETRKSNFRILADLAQPPNKVILTGRPGYFPSFSAIMDTFYGRIVPRENSPFCIDDLKECLSGKITPKFEILRLNLFSDSQLDEFLDKQISRAFPTKNGEGLVETLKAFARKRKQHIEIFTRPVLVWMMVKVLPKWIDKGINVSELNIATLYDKITEIWLFREENKGPIRYLTSSERRKKIAEDLAWELQLRGQEQISVPDLKQMVKEWFGIKEELEAEYVTHDIRLCTFLTLDEKEGFFKFIYNSFKEYFVAVRLVEVLKNGNIDSPLGNDTPRLAIKNEKGEPFAITETIRLFVNNMLYGEWEPAPCEAGLAEESKYGEDGKWEDKYGEDGEWKDEYGEDGKWEDDVRIYKFEGVEMVYVPPGPFIMGENADIRVVDVGFGFFIDRYPVTNEDFSHFIEQDGYGLKEFWSERGWNYIVKNKIEEPGFWKNYKFNQPNSPVVGVSFFEAEAFAKWAGKTLPTEIMWEKAARGIDGRIYPWGDDEPNSHLCNYSESHDKKKPLSPVSNYGKGNSPYGLFNMAGNVWEWCENKTAVSDHVYRGGSWLNDSTDIRCANRIVSRSRDYRAVHLGFRLAKPI